MSTVLQEEGMHKDYSKAEWDFFIVALKEEARTVLHQVGSNTDPQTLVESVLPDLEALAPPKEGVDDDTEKEIWNKIREILLDAAYKTRPYCIRCGECCTRCSPTLVEEDMNLFMKEILTPEKVTTIRKGEPAYSTVTQKVGPAEVEMLKIRESPQATTCLFYNPIDRSCTIYESRPLQCRAQECWQPGNVEETAALPKLARKAILQATGPLWEIIERHEERCSFEELGRVIARLSATKGQTIEDLIDLLGFDEHVRDFVSEQFNLSRSATDFFFGRPLRQAIVYYGLTVEDQPDGTFLIKPIEEGSRE